MGSAPVGFTTARAPGEAKWRKPLSGPESSVRRLVIATRAGAGGTMAQFGIPGALAHDEA
jgi:hypothetical protein